MTNVRTRDEWRSKNKYIHNVNAPICSFEFWDGLTLLLPFRACWHVHKSPAENKKAEKYPKLFKFKPQDIQVMIWSEIKFCANRPSSSFGLRFRLLNMFPRPSAESNIHHEWAAGNEQDVTFHGNFHFYSLCTIEFFSSERLKSYATMRKVFLSN